VSIPSKLTGGSNYPAAVLNPYCPYSWGLTHLLACTSATFAQLGAPVPLSFDWAYGDPNGGTTLNTWDPIFYPRHVGLFIKFTTSGNTYKIESVASTTQATVSPTISGEAEDDEFTLLSACPFDGGSITNGSLVESGGDGVPLPFLQFGATAICKLVASSRHTLVFPSGTLLLYYRDDAPTIATACNVIHSGRSYATVDGGFSINRTAVDSNLVIGMRAGGSSVNITYTPTLGVWYPLIVRWGPRYGLTTLFGQYEATNGNYRKSVAYYGGWQVDATRTLSHNGGVNGNANGVSSLAISAMWAGIEMEEKFLQDLMRDPFLPLRHAPDRNDHFLRVVPRVGREKPTSFDIVTTTGHGTDGSLEDAHIGIRVRVSTSADTVWAQAPSAVVEIGDVNKVRTVISDTVSGLTAGTVYYCAFEFTIDGNVFYPFPLPVARVVTQKPAGTRCRVNLFTDSHIGGGVGGTLPVWNSVSDGWLPETHGVGHRLDSIQPLGNPVIYLGMFNAFLHMYLDDDPADFSVGLGDNYGLVDGTTLSSDKTADINDKMFAKAGVINDAMFMAALVGGIIECTSNHDGLSGISQNVSGQAYSKQAILAFKRVHGASHPDATTYAEGGEDQGVPNTTQNNCDWVPPLDGTYDAAFRSSFVIAADDESGSPRRTWHARTWGDCLWVFIDIESYCRVGSSTEFMLGTRQLEWLTNLLMSSTARWKCVVAHSLLRGEDAIVANYRRGSGLNIGVNSALEANLHLLLRNASVTAYIKAHDHTFGHIIKDTVNYITVPSTGMIAFATLTADSYGDTTYAGATMLDGSPAPEEIKARYHVPGYVRVSYDADEFRIQLVQTSVQPNWDAANGYSNPYPTIAERWVGTLHEVADNAVAILDVNGDPVIPRDVGWVVPKNDMETLAVGLNWSSTNWATLVNAPSDTPAGVNYRSLTPPGLLPHEQWYTSNVIPIISGLSDGDEVYVNVAPRLLYEVVLENAKPVGNGGGEVGAYFQTQRIFTGMGIGI